jgi:hypothetical protein
MVTAIEPTLARGPEPESSERSFAWYLRRC